MYADDRDVSFSPLIYVFKQFSKSAPVTLKKVPIMLKTCMADKFAVGDCEQLG